MTGTRGLDYQSDDYSRDISGDCQTKVKFVTEPNNEKHQIPYIKGTYKYNHEQNDSN